MIALPFSDPMLTGAHLAIAASVAANLIVKGASFEAATAAAEKTMYAEVLRIPREEHDAPQNKEKEGGV